MEKEFYVMKRFRRFRYYSLNWKSGGTLFTYIKMFLIIIINSICNLQYILSKGNQEEY